MANKPTPGPWRLRTDPSHYDSLTDICDNGGHLIAQTCGDWSPMEANARLIAAAPDLLACVRTAICPGVGWNGIPDDVVPTVEVCVFGGHCGCDMGAALCKATGQKFAADSD